MSHGLDDRAHCRNGISHSSVALQRNAEASTDFQAKHCASWCRQDHAQAEL